MVFFACLFANQCLSYFVGPLLEMEGGGGGGGGGAVAPLDFHTCYKYSR